MRTLRRIVQLGSLIFFLWLIIKTSYPLHLGEKVSLFLKLSPAGMLLTSLSSRSILPGIFFSFFLLVFTFLLGRFFCGWFCPLGTTIDLSDRIFFSKRKKIANFNPRALKYYLLFFLFISSLLGVQSIGWVDPLSIIERSYALVFLPIFNFLGKEFFDLLYSVPGVSLISEALYTLLRERLLLSSSLFYRQGFFLLLVLVLILGMGVFSRRWWCRNLCPLGGLFALISSFSLLKRRVRESCSQCGICTSGCKMGAIDKEGKHTLSGECIECLTCRTDCLREGVSFKFLLSKKEKTSFKIDLSRRDFLLALLGGVVAFSILSLNWPRRKGNPWLIRPPGALPEEEFCSKCIRCGVCMKVCPTNGLHPALLEAGLEGLWTPLLVPRVGWCEYNCNLCTQICPTQAIRKLSLEEKKKIPIGTAYIDKNLCLPYAQEKNCLVCEEVCPIPTKAIKFERKKIKTWRGEKILLLPYVLEEDCIGCGICENKCPVRGRAAIRITVPNQVKREFI